MLNIDRNRFDSFIVIGLILLYMLFSAAFILESVAKHFLTEVYVKGLIQNFRNVFPVLAIIIIVYKIFAGLKLSKASFKLATIGIAITLFGFFVGAVNYSVSSLEFLSHFHAYISFVVISFSCSLLSPKLDDNFYKYLGFISFCFLCMCAYFVFIILIKTSGSTALSLTIYSLGIPLCYYMTKARPSVLYYGSLILAVLTFKRGIWVSVASVIFIGQKLNKKFSVFRISPLLIFSIGMLSLFVLLLSVYSDAADLNKLQNLFHSKLFKDSKNASGTMDLLTSGRVTNFFAVIYELEIRNSLLTGLGFGATYDASYGSNRETWITSGVDVIFLHFWLMHGLVIGTILFVAVVLFVLNNYRILSVHRERYFVFLYLLLVFNFTNSIFTFIPWDPIWPIIIGLIIGHKRLIRNVKIINMSRMPVKTGI